MISCKRGWNQFLGAFLFLMLGTQAPFVCPAHAQDIPYREGPHGGQIIDLDGPEPAGTGQNPEYVDPRGGAATGQAPKIKIPPRKDPPDWDRIREQMNGRQDNLQPFTESDARRLDEEYQAKQRRKAEVEAHKREVRRRRANPEANDLDLMMRRLDDPKFTTAEKQRMVAVLFVHQDTYREAVARGDFGADSAHVQKFLEGKKNLQKDVIQRMGQKYMQKYGKPLKEPIIPFDYNNIHSDDDVVTGGSKQSAELERLYAESLDEIIRERAGRPMSAADRARVDVNGLAWDMTQRGGMENFWHPEKYINPQSGFANQQKLIGAGDNLNVYTFDDNGKLVRLQGEDAVEAIRKLDVDRPMKIPGIDAEVGSGSMSDYIRMAEIHKIKFADGKDVTVAEVLQFIRNQKYTQRVDGDFSKISADSHPEIYKEYKRYIEAVNALRKQTTIRGAAEILEKLYGEQIIDPRSGLVDYDALKKVMEKHQNIQLTELFPKMHSAVTQNEAYKIAEWLKKAGRGKRAELRKQLALTYAPMDEAHRQKIIADLDNIDIDDESRAFLKNVIDKDAKQIVRYAQLLELETLTLTKSLKINGDNMAVVDRHIFENAKVKRLGDATWNRPGGSKFKEFLRTKTARALNLDVMLSDEAGMRGQKVFQWSVMLLAAGRAYSAGSDQTDSFKKVAAGLFEMVPGVAATLRFSEGEFRQSFKELCMDVLPPIALADLAVQVLNYTATYAISEFNESKLDQIAEQVLSEMSEDDFEESEDLPGYYRLKDKEFLFQYLEETSAGLGRVAKFPALVSQQVDALQQRDDMYKTNMAALHTLGYFEEVAVDNLDALIRKEFDLTELKARVWEQGIPGVGQASPVERVAAKIVADNLSIRAQAYETVLRMFIDRIENLYNEEHGHSPEILAIISQTQKKLKELYENAPQVIKDSAFASAEIDDEYRMRVEFLKDYKSRGKKKTDVAREMQELLDNFRETIDQLVIAAGFFDEQRDLQLQANYYGGDTSMEPLRDREILTGDEFRVGISARVSRHRKNQKWTVYYYVYRDDKWIVLGSQSLNSGKYREGGGLMVIEAPDNDTFIHIKGKQLEDYFTQDQRGYYRVHPVLAFGDWEKDPIAEVGLEALRAPAEYFELFSAEKMAFTGAPLEIMTIRPRVIVQVPEYVYQNDPTTEAYVVADVPDYAKEDAAEAEVELLLPDVGGGQPTVRPDSFSPVSTDPNNPDVIRISFPRDALDGEHTLLVRVRMRRLLEDYQPGGADYFQYLREDNPEGGGDEDGGGDDAGGEQAQSLDALLAAIEGLEAQAAGLKEQADNGADALRGVDRDISRAVNDLTERIAELEAEAEAIRNTPLDRANPDTIGLYEKDVYSAGQRLGEIRTRIQSLTIAVCESYEEVKSTRDVNQLDSIYGNMTANVKEVDRLNSEFKRLAAKMTSLKQRAEQEAKKAGGVSSRLESAEGRVAGLVGQASGIADQIAGMQTTVDQLRGIQGQAAALVQQAEGIVGQAHTRPEDSLQRKERRLVKKIDRAMAKVGKHEAAVIADASRAEGYASGQQGALAGALTSLKSIKSKLDERKAKATDPAVAQAVEQAMAQFNASYEAGMLFAESIEYAAQSAGTCMGATLPLYRERTSPQARVAQKDCSRWRGTQAEWDSGKRQAVCRCPGGFVWSKEKNRCISKRDHEMSQLNCSRFPNSRKVWNEQRQRASCECLSGYQPNRAGNACINPRQEVANISCARYGSYSEAYWDSGREQAMCRCMAGYVWNRGQTACVRRPPPQPAYDPYDSGGSRRNDQGSIWDDPNTMQQILEGFTGNQQGGSDRSNRPRCTGNEQYDRVLRGVYADGCDDSGGTQRSTRDNDCAFNYTMGSTGRYGSTTFKCNCSGWGFDPSQSRCVKGRPDRYSGEQRQPAPRRKKPSGITTNRSREQMGNQSTGSETQRGGYGGYIECTEPGDMSFCRWEGGTALFGMPELGVTDVRCVCGCSTVSSNSKCAGMPKPQSY